MTTMIFDPKPTGRYMPDFTEELLSALDHIFLSIVKLELDSGKAVLLQSLGQSERRAYEFEWERYINFYKAVLEPEEAGRLSEFLSVTQLKKLWEESSTTRYQLDCICRPETELDWLEVVVHFADTEKGPAAYILTLRNGDNHLLKRIIDLYVYSNCDYFICLDAKNNSYIMFSGSKGGTPLPPAVCSDYSAEIVKYAEAFVVPEDREMVVQEMNLDRVMEVLEHQEVHAFTCGVWEEGVGYTHKRLEYRYYNRNKKMILLSRTDITDIYNEQRHHTRELESALKRAQTDPLTGLLNYQGIQETVMSILEHSEHVSALLFLDLDNFKGVNDTYGHTVGDRALQLVAEVLKDNIRSTDYAARVGGDEFVVFLYDVQDAGYAAICAQRLCDHLYRVRMEEADIRLSGSIGVSMVPEDGTDYASLVKSADRKVYRAKAEGKNQFSI